MVGLAPRGRVFEMPKPSAPPMRCILNRFAYLHRASSGAALKLPGAACDVIFAAAACGNLLLQLAAGPVTTAAIGDPRQRALLRLLVVLGFAEDADTPEEPARRTWEFHDRMFHYAARSYPDRIVRGGTYRVLDTLPAPPALRPSYQGPVVALPSPGPERRACSRPLLDVMEARRSRRAMGAEPVSA